MTQLDFKFEAGKNEEYKVEGIYEVESIWDSTVFAKESEADHLSEICLPGVTTEALKSLHQQFDPPKARQRLYPNQPTVTSLHNGSNP